MSKPSQRDAITDIDLDEFLDPSAFGETGGENGSPANQLEDLPLEEFLPVGDDRANAIRPGGIAGDDDGSAVSENQEQLRERIACYYLNEQLRDSIVTYGRIPDAPTESIIGVGFVDIADYSYIANWLSPKENQIFLNGLYTAFHEVLKRNGGYLNKISGDSLMFHFGGIIDPATRGLAPDEAQLTIARTLFKTCVDIQRACRLFNKADREFLEQASTPAAKLALERAFLIIRTLRENLAMMDGLNALFQVRIRVGASLGEVCIGNFGPEGARQWDVIGVPVIEARRMESTAPVDGIRITSAFYDLLEKAGEVDSYFFEFTARAAGFYRQIRRDELFAPRRVTVEDKNGVQFDSYAVQANPNLPEDLSTQVNSFLDEPAQGASSIVTILKSHRGNRLAIHALDDLLSDRGIRFRRAALYRKLAPKRYASVLAHMGGDAEMTEAYMTSRATLFCLFEILGRYQDSLKIKRPDREEVTASGAYEERMAEADKRFHVTYRGLKRNQGLRLWFDTVLFPYVFESIEASVAEWQARRMGEASARDDGAREAFVGAGR